MTARPTALALVVLLASAPRLAHADAQADAERYFNQGQAAYDDKRYGDAIAAWQKSYDLTHLPALVYNLAQAHRLAGHCSQAVASYRAFIQGDPTSAQRPDAESHIRELEPCPPDAATPPPTVPTPPPPPTHVAAPPMAPVSAAPPPAGGHHLAGALVIGAGGALAIAGAVFGREAQSAASDVKSACANGCEWTPALAAKDSSGRTDQTVQYVLYGAGAAAVIAGLLVFRSGHHEHPAPVVTLVPRTDGAALTWSGAW